MKAQVLLIFRYLSWDHVHSEHDLRKCCEHDLRKEIEILAKLVFSFSIIVFNMMKLLVILFIMKLIAQINIFKYPENFDFLIVRVPELSAREVSKSLKK